MSSTVIDTKRENQVAGVNGTDTRDLGGLLTPEAQNSLADHPLWPEFLAELQASRLADKAAAELEWAEAASAE